MTTGMELQVLNVNQHQAFLASQEQRIEKWIAPSLQLRAEALTRYALHEMSLDQKLIQCTPTSIYLALLQCAVTGLVPGKMRGFAYLVPFNNTYGEGANAVKRMEATFMIGWKGVKHMAFRAGLDITSAIIHDKDDFDFDKGSAAFVRYKPALKGKGPVIGTAAWVKLPRGGLEVEYLDMERLERIQRSAERMKPSPSWRGDFRDSMQRKSAVRQLGRQIEMGEEFHKAEMLQNAEDAGTTASAIDALTDGEASRVLGAASTESLAFGQAPRPAQVQVPGGPKPERGKAARNDKPIEATSTEAARPTTGSAAQPTSSSSATGPANSAQQQAASPSSSPPAAQSSAPAAAAGAGASPTSASPAVSATTPAASSPAASTTTPTPTASAPTSTAETSASAPAAQNETSFNPFGDDPDDSAPVGPPAMSVDAFVAWCLNCKTQGELMEGKGVWVQWARENLTKNSPESIRMQDALAARWEAVPA